MQSVPQEMVHEWASMCLSCPQEWVPVFPEDHETGVQHTGGISWQCHWPGHQTIGGSGVNTKATVSDTAFVL